METGKFFKQNLKILNKKTNNTIEQKNSRDDSSYKALATGIITPCLIATKEYAAQTKQWTNGVYSFNKNFLKPLPSVDIVVNKIIKSFFTLNPLEYNPKGKKSRLLQRRYKRLSLNRILVSKPEIKHTNDIVYITVHVFNKKKTSLMYKIKHLYSNISFKPIDLTNLLSQGFKVKPNLAAKVKGQNNKTLKMKNKWNQLIIKARAWAKIWTPMRFSKKNNKKIRYIKVRQKKNNIIRYIIQSDKNNNKISNIKVRRRSNNKIRNLKVLSPPIMRGILPLKMRGMKKKTRGKNLLTSKSNILFRYKFKPYYVAIRKNLALWFKGKGFRNRRNYFSGNSPKKSGVVNNILLACNGSSHKNKGLDFIKTRNLLMNKIHTYLAASITDKQKKQILSQNLQIRTMFTKYYNALNKYRLYNDENFTSIANNDNVISFALNKTVNVKRNHLLRTSQSIASNKHITNTKMEKGVKNTRKLYKAKATRMYLSLQKLNAVYKLFSYYTKIGYPHKKVQALSLTTKVNYDPGQAPDLLNELSIYSSKILLNTYKLLKSPLRVNDKRIVKAEKMYNKSLELKNLIFSSEKTLNKYKTLLNTDGNNKNVFNSYKETLDTITGDLALKNKIAKKYTFAKIVEATNKPSGNVNKDILFNYYLNSLKNRIFSLHLRKIQRFFKKYNNILLKKSNFNHQENFLALNSEKSNLLCSGHRQLSEKNLSQVYKLSFIKEVLNKEILYLYYVKMLSFNNLIFKNGFLSILKNILSRIYNKKVVLNIINLKYIHLNSDILSQAITVRLRNFRKNRLINVLRKALKLVVLSKINNYSYDIHSPVYKYIENHYNRFKSLNIDIFNNKPHGLVNNTNDIAMAGGTSLTPYYGELGFPSKQSNPKSSNIRSLNQVQTSTINFIKYKSVFGVRLEAKGRLTKRSTASRAIFKLRYKGSLRNNTIISRTDSSVILKNNRISNLQYSKISSKTRNGSFGLKGWINNN